MHRQGPDIPLNNTVGDCFRDQGAKTKIFVITSVVKIKGKDSDDSSISSLLLTGELKK